MTESIIVTWGCSSSTVKQAKSSKPPKGVVVVTIIYDMNDTSGFALNNNW